MQVPATLAFLVFSHSPSCTYVFFYSLCQYFSFLINTSNDQLLISLLFFVDEMIMFVKNTQAIISYSETSIDYLTVENLIFIICNIVWIRRTKWELMVCDNYCQCFHWSWTTFDEEREIWVQLVTSNFWLDNASSLHYFNSLWYFSYLQIIDC